MTDLIEIYMSNVNITISARICSKQDHMADSIEISDRDVCMTICMQEGPSSHTMRIKRCQEGDQAQGACRQVPLRGPQDRSQGSHRQLKEEELYQRHWQAGHEKEEEQCQRSQHISSRRTDRSDRQAGLNEEEVSHQRLWYSTQQRRYSLERGPEQCCW